MQNVPERLEAPLRILVVDDIDASRRDLCALVSDFGHEAVAADSGGAALALMAERRPDLVLLDLLMPEVDGFEVSRRIRALRSDRWTPVIVTSSLQGDQHFIHALEAGADDYLVRPVNPALLRAKLRHYRQVLALQARARSLAHRRRLIQDNILDAVITVDEHGAVTEANRAACRIFGDGTPASLVGADCAAALGIDPAVLRAGGEHSLRRADGGALPARIGASAWDEQGRTHCTLVVRDLTEQRRIDRMKDEFLATVSHELRTPLTSVIGALGLLAAGAAGPLPPPAAKLAETAQRNGRRLSQLIDDILDLTKLEADALPMHLAPAQVEHLLAEAHAGALGQAERAGVTLTLDVAAPVAAVTLSVDPGRFQQVMANLLANAIRHSPAGGPVRISASRLGSGVRIAVRDSGPGVDPAFRARMFEKFSQADASDRRAQGGTGLGLYVSRVLVERMGGRIGLAPDDGRPGAAFFVEFPEAGAGTPSAWVLVIDSDLDARQRLSAWIAPLCEVEAADGPDRAHAGRQAARPPVVVADTRAQGDAEAFCAKLRRLSGGLPVILYSDSIDEAFARRAGVTWLSKSATPRETLVGAVRAALGEAKRKEGRG